MQPNWGLLEKMINQNEVLEYTDIEKLIPHRAPFLLIDKLTNAVPGESATGIKAVSGGESYFAGHFPSNPVMPGQTQEIFIIDRSNNNIIARRSSLS